VARAKRHYIAGQVRHLRHRCHKREFLLRFAKDRRRWLQWLFEAKRRYGLAILNYLVRKLWGDRFVRCLEATRLGNE
jgi:putative transposase